MKTSNKLLLGLLVVIILTMISVNLLVKYEFDKNPKRIEQVVPELNDIQHDADNDSL